MTNATKAVTRRGPKEKASTQLLLSIQEGGTFPRIKIFDLDEGPIDVNFEKSKLARSMESRMTQLRRKHNSFAGKKFTNQSFTSVLSDNNIVCGTVLTCVSGEVSDEASLIDDNEAYVMQVKELSIGDTMPIVNVVDPSTETVCVDAEKAFIQQKTDLIIDLTSETTMFKAARFESELFTTTLANGKLIFGALIKRIS